MKDPMLKLCYGCSGCYARMVDELSAAFAEEFSAEERELTEMETALEQLAQQRAVARLASLDAGLQAVKPAQALTTLRAPLTVAKDTAFYGTS